MNKRKEILEAAYDNLDTLDKVCEKVEKLQDIDKYATATKDKNELLDISLAIIKALNKHMAASNRLTKIITNIDTGKEK